MAFGLPGAPVGRVLRSAFEFNRTKITDEWRDADCLLSSFIYRDSLRSQGYEQLVGITHESMIIRWSCWKADRRSECSSIEKMSQSEINQAVPRRMRGGRSLYEVDEKLLMAYGASRSSDPPGPVRMERV